MAYYKEIVTKAVIGKGKKTKKEDYVIETNEKIDNVLGCWVINHNLNVNIKENASLTKDSEIIVRTLSQPSVIDVNVLDNKIKLTIEKQLGVEVIGDTTVRVSVEDSFDDYEEIDEDIMDEVDVTDDYLK